MTNLDIVLVYIPSCDGPVATYVDVALCRAPTKPCPPCKIQHVLEEMTVAAAADRVRRERNWK